MPQRNVEWEEIEKKILVKNRWLSLSSAVCRLPNGKIMTDYYTLDFLNWCTIVPILNDEHIIFVRQYRHAIKKTILELPGGVIDAGEDPANAAKRELLEETGYTAQDLQFLYSSSTNPATNNNRAFFYIAQNLTNTHQKNLDEFEDIEVVILHYTEVLKLLLEGKFEHGTQIGALYATFYKMKWI